MKTDVVIVAAGSSSRFGGDIPKQYCQLAAKPILLRTYEQFAKLSFIRNIIIVIAKSDHKLFEIAFAGISARFVDGGATRSLSVLAGLNALKDNPPDKVLIHDGARPFVSKTEIMAIIEMLDNTQACVPALSIIDAVKYIDVDTGLITADADRNKIIRVQTPQGFCYSSLMQVYKKLDNKQDIHDDLSLAIKHGMICKTIPGNPANFKITTQQDLIMAEQKMLKQVNISVTGTGFDVHQICSGDGMMLCGVYIAGDLSLRGHSDADVGLHAITDGLLGAMALSDIGDHFDPSEPQWKNANSEIFLKHANKLANENGGRVAHIDLTLICEAPKIKPHRQQMRQKIADILELELSQVSVKATTTELLGFTGRGEGIAAMASVTVRKEMR